MAGKLDIESLETLISAVQKYLDELQVNEMILKNAANVCDVAMGSDYIAQKHIAQLEEALVELRNTAKLAANVSDALINEKVTAEAEFL